MTEVTDWILVALTLAVVWLGYQAMGANRGMADASEKAARAANFQAGLAAAGLTEQQQRRFNEAAEKQRNAGRNF